LTLTFAEIWPFSREIRPFFGKIGPFLKTFFGSNRATFRKNHVETIELSGFEAFQNLGSFCEKHFFFEFARPRDVVSKYAPSTCISTKQRGRPPADRPYKPA
jgi:hypothetical protein